MYPTADAYPALPPPIAVTLVQTGEHACPYLAGRTAVNRALWAEGMPGSLYHRFMDAAFRRSGKVLYQPVCPACRSCLPLRVPVAGFSPDKSQRRCGRRNADLRVTAGRPEPTDEKFRLYAKYLSQWHDRAEPDGREEFEAFLYDSPVQSIEYLYHDAEGRLLGVGICDVCRDSLSSVYFYFDPDHAHRGLGTYAALFEIAEARRLGVPYYYLGYWVSGGRNMDYKAAFRPNEVLGSDGVWRANLAAR